MNFFCWFINGELFEIFRMSIKATHKEVLDFYMFDCFNISEHISISVLFFIISVSCFVGFFAVFLKIIAQGWGFSTIYLPQGSKFCTFFVLGGGKIALLKKLPGGLPGEWSGLELTDTLRLIWRPDLSKQSNLIHPVIK